MVIARTSNLDQQVCALVEFDPLIDKSLGDAVGRIIPSDDDGGTEGAIEEDLAGPDGVAAGAEEPAHAWLDIRVNLYHTE